MQLNWRRELMDWRVNVGNLSGLLIFLSLALMICCHNYYTACCYDIWFPWWCLIKDDLVSDDLRFHTVGPSLHVCVLSSKLRVFGSLREPLYVAYLFNVSMCCSLHLVCVCVFASVCYDCVCILRWVCWYVSVWLCGVQYVCVNS